MKSVLLSSNENVKKETDSNKEKREREKRKPKGGEFLNKVDSDFFL